TLRRCRYRRPGFIGCARLSSSVRRGRGGDHFLLGWFVAVLYFVHNVAGQSYLADEPAIPIVDSRKGAPGARTRAIRSRSADASDEEIAVAENSKQVRKPMRGARRRTDTENGVHCSVILKSLEIIFRRGPGRAG